jgi:hypothetical protein
MNRISSETIGTIDLDHEQLLVLQDRSGTRVRVLSGGVWLTEEGEPDDRFAWCGEELLLNARGRAVVEGMGRARIEVLQPPVRRAQRLRERLAAMRARFAAMRARFAALGGAPSVVLVRSLASVVSLILALGLPHFVARGFQQNAAVAPVAALGAQA